MIDRRYVWKYYQANPDVEGIIEGKDLKERMIVLIRDVAFREDVSNGVEDCRIRNANEMNRWCRVSDVRFDDDRVTFLATYADASEVSRSYRTSIEWIVKLNSM